MEVSSHMVRGKPPFVFRMHWDHEPAGLVGRDVPIAPLAGTGGGALGETRPTLRFMESLRRHSWPALGLGTLHCQTLSQMRQSLAYPPSGSWEVGMTGTAAGLSCEREFHHRDWMSGFFGRVSKDCLKMSRALEFAFK